MTFLLLHNFCLLLLVLRFQGHQVIIWIESYSNLKIFWLFNFLIYFHLLILAPNQKGLLINRNKLFSTHSDDLQFTCVCRGNRTGFPLLKISQILTHVFMDFLHLLLNLLHVNKFILSHTFWIEMDRFFWLYNLLRTVAFTFQKFLAQTKFNILLHCWLFNFRKLVQLYGFKYFSYWTQIIIIIKVD